MRNMTYKNLPPVTYDDQIPLATAIPPAVTTVDSTVYVENYDGVSVTLGFGANQVDRESGKYITTAKYSFVSERNAVGKRQYITSSGAIALNAGLGNYVTLSQTGDATVTLNYAVDANKVTVFDILRSASTGTPTLTFNNCITENGAIPNWSAAGLYDKIQAMWVPQLAKWVLFTAIGFSATTAMSYRGGGGDVIYKTHPEYETVESIQTGDPVPLMEPMKIGEHTFDRVYPPSGRAITIGQECVIAMISGAPALFASAIFYDKANNLYTSQVELKDTSDSTEFNIAQANITSGALTLDLDVTNKQNIFYTLQDQAITSFTIQGAGVGSQDTSVIWIRKRDAGAAGSRAITFDTNVFLGEATDAPTFTDVADAVDILNFFSDDGGLTWSTRFKNDFR